MNVDSKAILESYGTIVEGSDGWYVSNDSGGAVNDAYWSKRMETEHPPINSMISNVYTVMWHTVKELL